MEKVVDDLFPSHPEINYPAHTSQEEFPPITIEELQEATITLGNGKAPGPDVISK